MKMHEICLKLLSAISFFDIIILSLLLWTKSAERDIHYCPEYAKEDLQPILQKAKKDLVEEDYQLLFSQTGLGKAAVNALLEEDAILYLQQRFFAPVEYECNPRLLVVHSERLLFQDTPAECFMPALEDGDVLITFNGHFLGWRTGHAALVIDAERGITLEAKDVGAKSCYDSVDAWKWYPGFVVLRLKLLTKEERAEVALYAGQELVDLPYSLNIFNKKNELSGTNCAHLVWRAFYHFGYDIDSNGGTLVVPADIFKSDLLEVVQVYGIKSLQMGF